MSVAGLLARAGAAAMQGARRSRVGGVAAPVNSVAPVLSGAVEIGLSPAIAAGTWSGSPTFTYTYRRDGVAVGGLTAVSEATLEAHVYVAADIGPTIDVVENATNGGGSASADSNDLVFNDTTYLPHTAIGVSTSGLTLADGDTTGDQWAASRGGVACTLAALASTNRPAYSASGGVGGRPLLTFDGADNALTGAITKGSAWADYEIGIVGQRVAFGSSGDTWVGYYNATTLRFALQDLTASAARFSVVGGANLSGATDPDGVVAHYSGDSSGGTQNIRVAGAVEATTAGATTSRADGGKLSLGGNTLAGAAANIAVQAWYAGPALTVDQRTHLRALLTYHTGVAC